MTHVHAIKTLDSTSGDALFDSICESAEQAVPMNYIAMIRDADKNQRQSMFADFTHLCDPYITSVPDMFEKALAGLIAHGIQGNDISELLVATGLTAKSDAGGYALESALGQFRRFGTAIGRPPGLPRLMEAEMILKKSKNRMLNLTSSGRLGVAVGALVLADYVWASLIDHLGIILRDEPILRPVDIVFFAVERVWTDNGRRLFNLACQQTALPNIERSIQFGAEQASVAQKELFDLLESRAQMIGSER